MYVNYAIKYGLHRFAQKLKNATRLKWCITEKDLLMTILEKCSASSNFKNTQFHSQLVCRPAYSQMFVK